MQDSPPTNSNIFRTAARLLTFRLTQKEFLELGGMHLVFGLVCAWLVGMGWYWDDPGAHLLQRLGVGSVIYVFALSLFLCKLSALGLDFYHQPVKTRSPKAHF